jgi:hypothetical protein
MIPTADSPAPRRQIWPWILGFALAPVLVLGGMIWNTVHLSSDAAALRGQVMAGSGGGWHSRVQLTADRTALAMVRGCLAMCPEIPGEAREALAAIRSASVGVYQRGEAAANPGRDSLITAADATMAHRGWRRLVGVRESGKTVLIYLPAAAEASPSRICLAVCDRRELVIVAADVDADRLAQLGLRQLERQKLAAR